MKKKKKSERTREAILAAAAELFGRDGFERTTVRDVAERADIDPAMVIRYFKSKEGLFAEAATIRLELPDPGSMDRGSTGRQLITRFLALWEGGVSEQGMTVLLRSAASNEFAASKMREVFGSQVMPFIEATGPRETAARRAGLVSSQLLGLAMCRYVLRLPPVVALSREEIVEHVAPVLQAYATGD